MRAEQAHELFQKHKPYRGDALDRHCQRLAAFTLLQGELNGVELDPELVAATAWLHDIGLLVKVEGTRNYLDRGLRFAEPLVDSWGLEPRQRRIFEEMMLYNHSVVPVPGLADEAEMMRRAVQVEHSIGVRTHGLAHARVREVFRRHPRRGLTPVLLDFGRITVLHDGPRQLWHIFRPTLSAD
jgi:hypothetical protein